MRVEKDKLGQVDIPESAFYGIHSMRSRMNFPDSGETIDAFLIKSFLMVKLAAAQTNFKIAKLPDQKFEAINSAIEFLIAETDKQINHDNSTLYEMSVTDPYQGGAGTSLNMNINEIIANKALQILGKHPGDYDFMHPLDDVNMNQSTNDTFPTALKLASIFRLRDLADSFAKLQNSLQTKETRFRNILKLGRTQFQDAVPITLGQEFGAYAQAISRDRWRLYNAEERLRSVNLGGTAVGNSTGAPRDYVLNVVSNLKKISKLPVAKAEDLIDATQNLDVFVEVHGIVKAGAVSIIKICNDLRFLSSGPNGGIGEINLPPRQTGSTIMPGKVNPVILENAVQIGELIKGHDVIISNLVSGGNLELNAFLPAIAHLFLKSLRMLKEINLNLADNCIDGITANPKRCRENLLNSTAVAASLIGEFGYEKIQNIVNNSEINKTPFVEELSKSGIMNEKGLIEFLSNQLGIKIE